jgi:signal transduction histidine kinase
VQLVPLFLIFFLLFFLFLKIFVVSEITFSFIIICLLFLVLFSGALVYFVHRQEKRLHQLNRIIAAFSAGNYGLRSNIDTVDEIGTLAKNFNCLADKISQQIVTIEENTKELEQFAQKRNLELEEVLREMEDKERKLNEAKNINTLNSLVTSIAHEINNPMSIISGNIQLIESGNMIIEESFKKRLNKINSAIKRIATLINDISFFASIKDVTRISVFVNEKIADAINNIVPKDIEAETEGKEEYRIFSNPNLLTITLENILRNSVEAIQENKTKGKIKVRTFVQDPWFTIEICDNGGGIAEPDRIFEPFYSTNSEKKGLGMTFVYHAVKALNGEIDVANHDQGVRVALKFPAIMS